MPRRGSRGGWLAALAALLVAGTAQAASPAKGSTLTVRAYSARLMAQPRYIAPAVATISRGDFVTFEQASGDWYQVGFKGKKGWLNKQYVVEKRVQLSDRGAGATASVSPDEVALAGRGFNPDVEKDYKSRKPSLRFDHVDAIERVSVDPAKVAAFAEGGKVGGAR